MTKGHPNDAVPPNDGYPEQAFAELAALEAGSFWFRARNELLAWVIRKYCSDARDLLEVGCGTGFVLSGLRERFPSLRLSGTDLHDEGLVFARRRLPDVEFLRLDAQAGLPFDARFDVVGAFDVVEHIADHAKALSNIAAAARPGGWVILTVPQHQWLWSAGDDFAHHQRRYSRRELLDLVGDSGLEVVRVTSFVTLLLPVMIVSRLRNRKATYSPSGELALPRTVDRLFEYTMTVERALIRYGVNLPAGGSLLVIARRRRAPKASPG